MKKIIGLVLILIANQGFAQIGISSYKYKANKANKDSKVAMEAFVQKFGHKIQVSEFLDQRAKIRTDYFLAVIEKKLAEGVSIESMLDSIPHGSEGHHERFGKPEYFSKPDSIEYPESLPVFKDMGILIDGEVMTESVWTIHRDQKIQDKKKPKKL